MLSLALYSFCIFAANTGEMTDAWSCVFVRARKQPQFLNLSCWHNARHRFWHHILIKYIFDVSVLHNGRVMHGCCRTADAVWLTIDAAAVNVMIARARTQMWNNPAYLVFHSDSPSCRSLFVSEDSKRSETNRYVYVGALRHTKGRTVNYICANAIPSGKNRKKILILKILREKNNSFFMKSHNS